MSRQHFVLSIGCALLLLATLVPPWRKGYDRSNGWDERSIGHRFLLDKEVRVDSRVRIDAGKLLSEVVAIVAITGLTMVLWRDQQAKT